MGARLRGRRDADEAAGLPGRPVRPERPALPWPMRLAGVPYGLAVLRWSGVTQAG
jgi:hypothetical protein